MQEDYHLSYMQISKKGIRNQFLIFCVFLHSLHLVIEYLGRIKRKILAQPQRLIAH